MTFVFRISSCGFSTTYIFLANSFAVAKISLCPSCPFGVQSQKMLTHNVKIALIALGWFNRPWPPTDRCFEFRWSLTIWWNHKTPVYYCVCHSPCLRPKGLVARRCAFKLKLWLLRLNISVAEVLKMPPCKSTSHAYSSFAPLTNRSLHTQSVYCRDHTCWTWAVCASGGSKVLPVANGSSLNSSV